MSKLDEQSLKIVFLEYVDNELGYQLWEPLKRRIIRSRDVVFNERNMFKIVDKGAKTQKIVQIQEQQEN